MTPNAAAEMHSPSLAPGTRLGPYAVGDRIGAGGMGEVYRARDTRLERSVAIKVLPPDVASDPRRRRRFEREARAVAVLEHPHICVLHDIGSEGGVDFLVMELLEGQTLAHRLKKGRVPGDEALQIAVDIADALASAHRQGITHRDLKPANVMLTKSGVKLLDFGLAKLRPEPAGGLEGLAMADPTSTETGAILGTLPYMAPEQVEGREADARSDLWSLGVVLYEMLSGRRAFAGATAASLIASILEHEPEPLRVVDALTPPVLDRTIRRCLAKDPDARWQSARDVADELRWVAEGAGGASGEDAGGLPRRRVWPWVAATALLGTAVVGFLIDAYTPSDESTTVIRSQLSVAPAEAVGGAQPLGQWIGGTRTSLTFSPDGRHLAFVGRVGNQRQLYVRDLGDDRATSVPGTEGAENPCFSQDGKEVAFWARESLWKVALSGGPPVRLCRTPRGSPFGISWGPDGRIALGAYSGGLQQVSDAGGEPRVLTELGPDEVSHRLPYILPNGDGVVFTALRRYWFWSDTRVVVQSFATRERSILVEGGADGRYVPTGHIVFLRLGNLLALPFDPVRLRASGGVGGLEEGIAQAVHFDNPRWESGAGQFSFSRSGTLAYIPGGGRPREKFGLARVDRSGVVAPLPTPPRVYFQVRLAPDGSRAALDAVQKNGLAVFLADVQTGVTTLLEQGEDPIWSPDGREVLFRRSGKGLFRRTVGEPGPAELVLGEAENCVPVSWVDGAGGPTIVRLVRDSSGSQHYDMEQLSWDGTESSVRPLRATPNEESFPEISPDGRWLAYVSDESGQREVYLQSFPEETSRRQVSTDGGTDPAWSADGRELFYITPKRDSQGRANMMSVRLLDSAPLRLATPVVLFDYDTRELALGCFLRRCHDVAPDGQGFYVAARVGAAVEAPDITHINLVVNWAKELKARVPVGK